MTSIKELLTQLTEILKSEFSKRHQKFEPKMYFILRYPDQKNIAYLPVPCSRFFASSRLKSMLPVYVSMAWERQKMIDPAGIELLCVCLAADAKFNQHTEKKLVEGVLTPLNDPTSRDCFMILFSFPGYTKSIIMEYHHLSSGIEFVGNPIEMSDDHDGHFAHLHPDNYK